jgi:hypothetical protein
MRNLQWRGMTEVTLIWTAHWTAMEITAFRWNKS